MAKNKNIYKQIQRIVVPRFRSLIVWGAIIKVLYQFQNFWYEWKGIITRNVMYMWNMKAISLMVHKSNPL